MFGPVVIASVLLVGLPMVAYGTVARNRWGINLKPVTCPCCHAATPQVRKPKSLLEAIGGGWTCENCGCMMDTWDRQAIFKNHKFE